MEFLPGDTKDKLPTPSLIVCTELCSAQVKTVLAPDYSHSAYPLGMLIKKLIS